jgi:CHAD domain-containing protein
MNAAVNPATTIAATPMNGITPPRQCVRAIIGERVQKLLSHEEATRNDTDVEALHDMRVASRRLREAFEIFDFCFPQKSYQKFYRRIKQVTRALGDVRNADVATIYFKNLSATTDDILVQVALEDILRRMARERRQARLQLTKGLDESRVSQLPAELANVFVRVENLPVRYQRGPRQSIVLARRQLSQRVREFFSARAAVTGENDEVNLHKVRIAVKKLRYAIETFDYAVGEAVTGNLKELKRLQEAIGELHDRDVFAGIVRKRLVKLQSRQHATLLSNGLQAVLNMILNERRDYFRGYESLVAKYSPQEWRTRFVPPANVSRRPQKAALERRPSKPELKTPPQKTISQAA